MITSLCAFPPVAPISVNRSIRNTDIDNDYYLGDERSFLDSVSRYLQAVKGLSDDELEDDPPEFSDYLFGDDEDDDE